MLKSGNKIKNLAATLQDGNTVKLKELCGKSGLVLYFYPRDNTPGCTTEACSFRDNIKSFNKLGFQVAGISADTVASHNKFILKQNLNFPLIADTDLVISNAFGVYGEKKFMGKTHMGINRSTFVLDPDLKILYDYPKIKVKEHVDQILKDLTTPKQ